MIATTPIRNAAIMITTIAINASGPVALLLGLITKLGSIVVVTVEKIDEAAVMVEF